MKKTKKEVVYDYLKHKINSGELQPGERITQSSIAKVLKVSEIPVREAIQMLAHDDLVQLNPHSGAVVTSLTKKDIKEVFQLRIELESLATRLAVSHLSNNHLDKLEEIIEESEICAKEQEFAKYQRYNRLFHETIYEYCGNYRLQMVISELWDSSSRHPRIFSSSNLLKQSINEHRQILNALLERNPQKAEKEVRNHKERAMNVVLEMLESKERSM